MELLKKELEQIKGGVDGVHSTLAKDNTNTTSLCSCDYNNKNKVINSNQVSNCSCNCV